MKSLGISEVSIDTLRSLYIALLREYWALKKRKNRDWLDENDVTIQSLLESKSKVYNAFSKCVTSFQELISLKSRFNSIKTEIQRESRKMQNT